MSAESDREKLAERRQAMETAISMMDEEKKQFLAEIARDFHVIGETGRLPIDLSNILEAQEIVVTKSESRGRETIRAISPTDWKNAYDILGSEGFYDDETEVSGHDSDPDQRE